MQVTSPGGEGVKRPQVRAEAANFASRKRRAAGVELGALDTRRSSVVGGESEPRELPFHAGAAFRAAIELMNNLVTSSAASCDLGVVMASICTARGGYVLDRRCADAVTRWGR